VAPFPTAAPGVKPVAPFSMEAYRGLVTHIAMGSLLPAGTPCRPLSMVIRVSYNILVVYAAVGEEGAGL
jgi:hypothetical protein